MNNLLIFKLYTALEQPFPYNKNDSFDDNLIFALKHANLAQNLTQAVLLSKHYTFKLRVDGKFKDMREVNEALIANKHLEELMLVRLDAPALLQKKEVKKKGHTVATQTEHDIIDLTNREPDHMFGGIYQQVESVISEYGEDNSHEFSSIKGRLSHESSVSSIECIEINDDSSSEKMHISEIMRDEP